MSGDVFEFPASKTKPLTDEELAAAEREAQAEKRREKRKKAPAQQPPPVSPGTTSQSNADGPAHVGQVVPAPSKPLAVGRLFVEERYRDERACRLLHHRGLFYDWHGTHWREAEAAAVRSQLYRWLGDASYIGDDKKLRPWDPSKGRISNVVDALQSLVHASEHVEPPAWLDDNDLGAIVAMRNGLLAQSTRELHPHSPAFFNHYSLPFAYDPNAPEPARWHRFLQELWGNDAESINTLQEEMGYMLAGGTEQQKLFIVVGPKRSGKGTIGRVLSALLGCENVAAPTLSSLATNFGLQPLVGKPLALISDARLGGRADALVAVERLLSISGEDSITIDRKFKDPWTGRLPTRFLVLTNEIPRFTDASGALASRFVILVLTESFYGREDTTLTDQLLAEAPGIFNWCLEGLDRLAERGHFVQPQAAKSALQHLEDLASPVAAFVRDHCKLDPKSHVPKDALWKAWRDWCADEGALPGTKAVFVRDLKAALPGLATGKISEGDKRVPVIRGLTLLGAPTIGQTPDTLDSTESVSGVEAENGQPDLAQPSQVSGVSGVDPIAAQRDRSTPDSEGGQTPDRNGQPALGEADQDEAERIAALAQSNPWDGVR